MMASAKERFPGFDLAWSLDAKGGAGHKARALELAYQVDAAEEIYVGDRLWVDDAGGTRVPDPMGVYRFVHQGSLRLVLAQAPLPQRIRPRIVFHPLFTRIAAGESIRKTVSIALPVDEYSALARDVGAETVVEEVERVYLVLSYRLRSTMDADPAPPPLESAEDAGYIVNDPKLAISSVETPPLAVKRRTGVIPRFLLPGETA